MIEQVEEFSPVLQPVTLAESEVLDCGEIHVKRSRTNQSIAAGGAKGARRIALERFGGKPLPDAIPSRTAGVTRLGHHVGLIESDSRPRVIVSRSDVERKLALPVPNTGSLPAPQQRASHAMRRRRHLPYIIQYEPVRHIEIGYPPVSASAERVDHVDGIQIG